MDVPGAGVRSGRGLAVRVTGLGDGGLAPDEGGDSVAGLDGVCCQRREDVRGDLRVGGLRRRGPSAGAPRTQAGENALDGRRKRTRPRPAAERLRPASRRQRPATHRRGRRLAVVLLRGRRRPPRRRRRRKRRAAAAAARRDDEEACLRGGGGGRRRRRGRVDVRRRHRRRSARADLRGHRRAQKPRGHLRRRRHRCCVFF
mmetsp:Transcript_23847/g.73398  ORF Transcript_23847/g.73398 Transcript_23847/m.73398 type:complete len:201 (+) Transcript_23847:1396-1998(+)